MALSNYTENSVLDLLLGGVPYVRSGAVYLDLFTSAPDEAGSGGSKVPVGAGYAGSLVVANTSFNFPPAINGVKSCSRVLSFGTPTGSGWGVVVGVGAYDAYDNLLAYFSLASPEDCVASLAVDVPAGTLLLLLSGGWETPLANALLDHLFGGPNFVINEYWFYGLLSGATELGTLGYARASIANDLVNFPAAVGGAKQNGAAVLFGPAGEDWVGIDHYALYDAQSGGNYSMHFALTTPAAVASGDSISFDPGAFGFTLTG